MRIVEREGTGSRSGMKSIVTAATLLGAALCSISNAAWATEVTLAVDQCERVSVAVAHQGRLLTGAAALTEAYALVPLVVIGDGGSVSAAGEGTGSAVVSPDTNAAGEGTGVPVINPGTNAAGEGTGAPGSSPTTNAAGEGTGLEEVVVPGTNAAGEGTGSPLNFVFYAEVLINSAGAADLVIYEESASSLSEISVYSNVAVSGLASGNGCVRE